MNPVSRRSSRARACRRRSRTAARRRSARSPRGGPRRRGAAGAAEHEMAELAAEGRLEVRLGEDLARSARCRARARLISTAWSQYSGTEPRLWVEISITRPSARSSVRSLTICVLGLHVDAGERLVEQDHLPLLRQRPRQEHPLLLPARQFADLPVAERRHADPRRAPPRPARGRAGPAGAASPCGRSGPSSPRPRPAPGRSSRPPRPAARRRRGSPPAPPAPGARGSRPAPVASGTKPMIALNSVDLPEPFTPTSAVIVPRGTAKLASSTAVSPLR